MTPRSPLIQTDRNSPSHLRADTVRVRRGIRAKRDEWMSLTGSARYRERVHAASVALRDPLLAFESAAVLHRLPVFGEPRYVHVFVDGDAHSYRQGDVQSHTGVDGRDETRIDGIRVTTLVDTVIDLIRVLPLGFAVAVADASLRMGASIAALEDRLRAQRNPRGRARAWDALRRSDPRAESPFESVSRVLIDLLGFEPPELQVALRIDGRERRPDFLWRAARVAGEADGDEKYFLGDQDETRRRVRDQRRRDIELQLVVDRTLHWEWGDSMHPERLERILTVGGVPRVRPATPNVVAAVSNGTRTVRRRR